MSEFSNPCPAGGTENITTPTRYGTETCPTCGREAVHVVGGRYVDHSRPET